MKTQFLYAVVLAACAFTAGCSKQSLTEQPPIVSDTIPKEPGINIDPVYYPIGGLTGKVMPETKFTVLLYNDEYSYDEFVIVDKNGFFLMKDIQKGVYNLQIQPLDPTLNPIELTKIIVDSARTTSLGLIYLP